MAKSGKERKNDSMYKGRTITNRITLSLLSIMLLFSLIPAVLTTTPAAAATAPTAAFTADTTSGIAPLTVNFTDESTETPASWEWDFDNDGNVDSTDQNPSYTYTGEGIYTVTLTATNGDGSDDEVKTDYITVISPDLEAWYVTWLGGSGYDSDHGITVDSAGNTYLVGETQSSDFPTTTGAFQENYGGDTDAFLAKFDSSGDLVYSTYFGGTDNDYAYDIAVDDSGNVYITGDTYSDTSESFPLKNAYQSTFGGGNIDIYLAKFSPTDTSIYSLEYCTYLGGTADDYAEGIAVDDTGNTYITGYSHSADFPLKNATQLIFGGNCDVFMARFDSSGTNNYCTYLGGNSTDHAYDIVVDDSGNVYITGDTSSTDLPVTDGTTYGTYADAFLAKFSPPDSLTYDLEYFTYLSGDNNDYPSGIALDDAGNIYITGKTQSTDLPTSDDAFQKTNSSESGFIAKYSPTSSAYSLNYCTYAATCQPTSIAIDDAGNIYLAGQTWADNVTEGFPIITGGFQTSMHGNSDGFVMRFAPSVSETYSLDYCTYIGDDKGNGIAGLAMDDAGNIYMIGQGKKGEGFTTTDDAYQAVLAGSTDVFFARRAAPAAAFSADITSCNNPLTVTFTDQSILKPSSWTWDFNNDGTIDSTAQNPSYTYTTAGTYTVKLTASNVAGSDDEVKTGYITVAESMPVAAFTASNTGTGSLTVNFTDLSTGNPTSWAWDFDNDGTVDSNLQNPSHTYADAGTYTVKLTATNTVGSDNEVKIGYVTVAAPPQPTAAFISTDTIGTGSLTVNFTDLSTGNPTAWAWDFNNDGTVDSTEQNPSYTYSTAGIYTVKLTATNTIASDAEVKTAYVTVAALPSPVAAFTATDSTGTGSLTVSFADLSTGNPTSWAWDFNNDGTVDSTEQNPSYTYTEAGTYTVKLTATNASGSDDEVKTNYMDILVVEETKWYEEAENVNIIAIIGLCLAAIAFLGTIVSLIRRR